MLLVFIIATGIGVYYLLNNSAKESENNPKLNERAEEKTSEYKQIDEEVIYVNKVENEEILVNEKVLLDTNFTEISIGVEELAQTDNADLEKSVEEQVQSSPESQSHSDNKGEIYAPKSSNRRLKKKRV